MFVICIGYLLWYCSQANKVFLIKLATVIEPTPLGTGGCNLLLFVLHRIQHWQLIYLNLSD